MFRKGAAVFSLLALAALMLALGRAVGASSAPARPSGTLQVKFTITQKWRMSDDFCPTGTPRIASCVRSIGEGEIPGLGRVTVTYFKILPYDGTSCFIAHHNTAVIEVAGRGTLELSRPGRVCASGPPPRVDGPLEFSFAGGSGRYAGATGMLVYKGVVRGNLACECGTSRDTWTGTVAVPGLEFDITPPILTGAVSKKVRAPKRAKRARVRYTVTATDAVDGSVPVVCAPRSGTFFEIGRTKVACSASDSSSNTRRVRFSIIVERRSR